MWKGSIMKTLKHSKVKLKKTSEDNNSPCIWIDKISIVKMTALSREIYKFSAVSCIFQ